MSRQDGILSPFWRVRCWEGSGDSQTQKRRGKCEIVPLVTSLVQGLRNCKGLGSPLPGLKINSPKTWKMQGGYAGKGWGFPGGLTTVMIT